MSKDPTWISEWNPEDETFWNSKGKVVARRNLIWSIVAEHIGFSVWLIWSIVATKLPQAGFHYTTDQLFQLVAVPGLIGSVMRFPYTFAITTFGGRTGRSSVPRCCLSRRSRSPISSASRTRRSG
jgi:MFS transporter, NNP family, nitrate/nitrite transporter